MPKIPEYSQFTVASAPLPGVRQNSVASPSLFGAQAEGVEKFGAGAQTAGNAGVDVALKMQEEANTLRVDDALNKAKEAAQRWSFDPKEGYVNIKGEDALARPSNKHLADEYGEKLGSDLKAIGDSLGNDIQRAAFGMKANDLLTNFKGQVAQHTIGEYRSHTISVREATLKQSVNDIGLFATDEAKTEDAIKSARAAAADLARVNGKSAAWAEQTAQQYISNGHKLALTALTDAQDSAGAARYLAKYGRNMDTNDLIEARKTIAVQVDTKLGLADSAAVVQQAAPRLQTSDVDRLRNIRDTLESGGSHWRGDAPITSGAGAVGRTQVMPKTGPEAAKLAGLPWNPELFNRKRTGDPVKDKEAEAYNQALGNAYLDAQLRAFNGDPAKALAAYNAGPGATAAAVATADKNKGQSFGDVIGDTGLRADNFLAYLPKETRDYVAKGMTQFNAGDGAYQKPTLQELHNQVRERVGTDNPRRLKVALDNTTQLFNESVAAVKQRNEEYTADAMRTLISNGGHYDTLPPSVKARVPPDKVDNLINFGKTIASGKIPETDWDRYYALRQFAFSNPAEFGKYELILEFPNLNPKEREALIDLQTKMRKPEDAKEVATLENQLSNAHDQMKWGASDKEKKGMFDRATQEAIFTAQKEKGKPLDYKERQVIIDRMLIEGKVVGSGFVYDDRGRYFEFNTRSDAGKFEPKVPSDERKKIEDALKRAGQPVTDASVSRLYRRKMGLP